MKKSEIKFNVELDEQNVPEKIFWSATDSPSAGMEEARAITISVWDHLQKNTLRIDLWGKEMTMDDMKRFYIDTVGGLAQSMRTATGDEKLANMMDDLCKEMVEHIKKNPNG
ncbi:gliding motility protein GldC [Sediminitomix flava]|uniref:Gliding motility-associated protein GldC n=1 Tax=Sediminitomix flava TaxID=379075 RepID=A0A315ZHH5_SEDFL|nr:gliding motility protein GldC [Sediminitomix flava]PWJ44248.1 gliding motility-associated protein GldC [Sediminitomix flava]